MVSGVSFSNFGNYSLKGVQKQQGGAPGNPPQEFLDKLKQSGIPEDIISKGRDAVMAYANEKNITLPQPPAPPSGGKPEGVPPAGNKSQGVEHANSHSMLIRETGDELKAVMDENNIPSTGNLKDDLAAIKSTLKSLDKDSAELLKDKLALAGVPIEDVGDKAASKNAFKGLDQLGAMNKHLLVGKSHKKSI